MTRLGRQQRGTHCVIAACVVQRCGQAAGFCTRRQLLLPLQHCPQWHRHGQKVALLNALATLPVQAQHSAALPLDLVN